jgi:beta-galactosidase beta subunit
MWSIGITDNIHHKIQTKNLFLLSGLSSIKENEYAQITIGKNDIKNKNIYINIVSNIKITYFLN